MVCWVQPFLIYHLRLCDILYTCVFDIFLFVYEITDISLYYLDLFFSNLRIFVYRDKGIWSFFIRNSKKITTDITTIILQQHNLSNIFLYVMYFFMNFIKNFLCSAEMKSRGLWRHVPPSAATVSSTPSSFGSVFFPVGRVDRGGGKRGNIEEPTLRDHITLHVGCPSHHLQYTHF